MISLYIALKFVHVLAVIVWVGGVVAVSVLNARLTATREPAVIRAVAEQSGFLGRTLMGPSALVTLLAGIGLLFVTGFGMRLWVVWGLVGAFGSIAVGAGVLERSAGRFAALASSPETAVPALSAARRHLVRWSWVNILLLVSTVAAMVFKPTL